MSYGPPSSRTPYGDQDFIKEDSTPPQQPQQPMPYPPPAAARYNPGYNQSMPYSTLAPPQPSPYNLEQSPLSGQRQPPNQVELQNIVQSLTPEDQIFMKSWRRDSFIYRVLPFSVVSNFALYLYNQSRNLPHKTSRYLLLSGAAYIAGKWSYKGELRRRLESNPSNTPFMKAMRELLGVRPSFSELGPEFIGDGGQNFTGFSDDTSQQADMVGSYKRPMPGSGTQPYGQTSSYQDLSYSSHDTDMSVPADGSTTKTSYEELRARNRGLIQK